MSTSNPTFEEVDKHIQSADLSALQSTSSAAANSAAAIPNVCQAYSIIRPVLQLVSNLPLIPKKWKDAVKAFIQIMDSFCPMNP